MDIPRTFARFKARQSRGGSWVQLFLNIGIITANIALFKHWFESFGISLTTMLAIGAVGYVIITITIGYIDERHGVWQHENEYNSNLNPIMRKIQNSQFEIKALLNKKMADDADADASKEVKK